MFLGLKNEDGVQEEIEKINKALGEGSKYGCRKYGNGYELEKKEWSRQIEIYF